MFSMHMRIELDLFQGSEMAFVGEFVVQSLRILCPVRNYNLSEIQLGCKPSPSPYSGKIFREGPRGATQCSVLTEFLASYKPLEGVR